MFCLFVFLCISCSKKSESSAPPKVVQDNSVTVVDSATPDQKVTDTARTAKSEKRFRSLLSSAAPSSVIYVDGMINLKKSLSIEKLNSVTIEGVTDSSGFTIAGKAKKVLSVISSQDIRLRKLRLLQLNKSAPVMIIRGCGDISIDSCTIGGFAKRGITAQENYGTITINNSTIHSNSQEGVSSKHSTFKILNTAFLNNSSRSKKSIYPHIKIDGTASGLRLYKVTFDRETNTIKSGSKKMNASQFPLNTKYFSKNADFNLLSLKQREESNYTRFKITRGEGCCGGDGPQFDIPVTYALPVKWSKKVRTGTTQYFTDTREFTFIDSASYYTSHSTSHLKLYRTGAVMSGSLSGGLSYLVDIDYSSKHGASSTTPFQVIRKNNKLYYNRSALTPFLKQFLIPPFYSTENAAGAADIWDGLGTFKLFSAVDTLVIAPLDMLQKRVNDTILVAARLLINESNYIKRDAFEGEPAFIYGGNPVYAVTNKGYGDSTSFLLGKSKNSQDRFVNGYHMRYPDGVVSIFRWENLKTTELAVQPSYPSVLHGTEYTVMRSFITSSYDSIPEWGGHGSVMAMVDSSKLTMDALLSVGAVRSGTLFEDSIYVLKNPKHWMNKHFYNKLKYARRGYNFNKRVEPLYAPKQFFEHLPYFFLRDHFGSLICYSATQFIPQNMSEPILYLYSDSSIDVDISLHKSVEITAAIPAFETDSSGSTWRVKTLQDGMIEERSSGRKHRRLFWEGESINFPPIQEGFVCSPETIRPTLDSLLTVQGLIKAERDDFITAWLPEMSEKPYVAFTFYDERVIECHAPLVVTPKPETIIRVMMGYKPIDSHITLEPQQIPTTKQRTGFTVVEWGGFAQ